MKQLYIVNSGKALNAGATAPTDLSGLQEGAIAFWELGEDNFLSAAPTKKFAIALGRGNNSPALVFPEVDYNTLQVSKTFPSLGNAAKFVFTFPTPEVGKEYTITLIKLGAVPHERNTFTCSIVAKTTTASTEAERFVKAINSKSNALLDVTASNSGAVVTITGNKVGDGWGIKLIDSLESVSLSTNTPAKKTIGDKTFIADLASRCAAGKGFNLLSEDGKEIYPGYPESVEDITPNASGTGGASTAGYVVYNLHFATKREAGKQLNELVWQYVHIAVPISATSYSAIDAILSGAKEDDDAKEGNASGD